jgi:hypothetical protein
MKRTLLVLLIVAAAFNAPALAGLGNSEKEITALFGKTVDPGAPDSEGVITNTYEKGDYIILVQFAKGSCVAETYTRKDRRKFSDKEIMALLNGSAHGKEWKKQLGAKPAWARSDHGAQAWTETLAGRPTLLIQAKSES